MSFQAPPINPVFNKSTIMMLREREVRFAAFVLNLHHCKFFCELVLKTGNALAAANKHDTSRIRLSLLMRSSFVLIGQTENSDDVVI